MRYGSGGYLVEKGEVPERPSPDGQWFAAIRNDDVVLRSTRDGREQRLTFSGTPDRSATSTRSRGTRAPALREWSPDSLTLLAYRRDIGDCSGAPASIG